MATETRDRTMVDAVLRVRDLTVDFVYPRVRLRAIHGVSFDIRCGEILGLIGESGCGKSLTALAILGLVPPPGQTTAGSIDYGGQNLRQLDEKGLTSIRGNRIAMIFQEPMTALNPAIPIGRQVAEPLVLHRGVSWTEAERRAVEMLDRVRIPDARRRAKDYPHQFSGGMLQRAMLAMALVCGPDLLLADEPTTALDVTIQAQILALLEEIRRDFGTTILLITHDLSVVADVCDRVVVMYAGEIAEQASVFGLFAGPRHPYTQALIAAVPRIGDRRRIEGLPGQPPPPAVERRGCPFAGRCPQRIERCWQQAPPAVLVSEDHLARCWRVNE